MKDKSITKIHQYQPKIQISNFSCMKNIGKIGVKNPPKRKKTGLETAAIEIMQLNKRDIKRLNYAEKDEENLENDSEYDDQKGSKIKKEKRLTFKNNADNNMEEVKVIV